MELRGRRIFCTYIRFRGILWILGWFLVGISREPYISGYATDFANCYVCLVEVEGRIPDRFWFFHKNIVKRLHIFEF